MASQSNYNRRVNHALRDDSDAGTAATLEINPEMQKTMKVVESLGKEQATRNDHNNRLIRMIAWVLKKIADGGIQININEIIRDLTDEEKADRVNYHKCKQDFIYSKYPAELTKLFLSDPAQMYKKRASPTDPLKQYSFDHLRKYHDAILFGANRARQKLPAGYGQEMKAFLDSLKKRNARAKKEGIVEEKQADPISLPLYKLICRWAIQTGDTFFWAFTVLLWNCMARCGNVDELRLSNFVMGTDSIILQFKTTKMDATGEKTSPKNIYSNPFDFRICPFTALGCYFALQDQHWIDAEKKIYSLVLGQMKDRHRRSIVKK